MALIANLEGSIFDAKLFGPLSKWFGDPVMRGHQRRARELAESLREPMGS